MQAPALVEPSILTANTYFWSPATSADQRRRNEARRQEEIATYFAALGMRVEHNGDSVCGEKDGIVATFHYSESCKNIYKSLAVRRNGKNSNITALRKLAAQLQ